MYLKIKYAPYAILKSNNVSVVSGGGPEAETRVFLPLRHSTADHVLFLIT